MIPSWLNEKLANPPAAGAGIHAWLFSVARQLHAHMDEAGIVACLTAATASAGRRVTAREIADAAKNSREVAWVKGKPVDRREPPVLSQRSPENAERWPVPCAITRAARILDSIAEGVRTVADLTARGGDCDGDCDDWIDRLLPDAEWVCMASGHPATARSRQREKWLFDESQDLIVPSPMTGPSGKGLDGKQTHRCLANTGPRRWLVVEFDSGTLDEQAAIHWHFSRCSFAPLRAVVFSGVKSLHGWYGPVASEESAREMMSYAVLHGADPATFTRCQLVRRPAGVRKVPSAKFSLPDWEFEAGCDPRDSRVRWDAFQWPSIFDVRQDVIFYAK